MSRQVFPRRPVALLLAMALLAIIPMASLAQSAPVAPSPQPKAVATPSAPSDKTHARSAAHRSRHRRKYSAHGKRIAYRPEFQEHSVQIINGSSTQNLVLKDDPNPDVKTQPAQMKVEVLNGTQKDTQYFRNGNPSGVDAARLQQPVVVGIQSSDTRMAGGNQHPVVTRITTSGSSNVRAATSGGQKVAAGVAPHPKRRAYQSDSH